MAIIKFSKNRKIKLNFIKRYSKIMKKWKGINMEEKPEIEKVNEQNNNEQLNNSNQNVQPRQTASDPTKPNRRRGAN